MGEQNGQSHSALRIVAACPTTAEFVAAYARYCEGRSLFIATKSPKAIGQIVKFKIVLASGEHLMTGVGPVVEIFADRENRFGRPGMRVEVEKLDAQGRHWMEQLRARGSATATPRVVSAPTGMFSIVSDEPAPAAAPAPPVVPESPPEKPAAVPVPVADNLSAGWEMDGPPAALMLAKPKVPDGAAAKKRDKRSEKKADREAEKPAARESAEPAVIVSGEVEIPPPLPPPPSTPAKGRSKRITFPALMFNKPRGLAVPAPSGAVVPKPLALLPPSSSRETTGKLRPPTPPIERDPAAPVAPLGTPADTEPHSMVPAELEASIARPLEAAEGTPPPPPSDETHPEIADAPPESTDDVVTSATDGMPRPRRGKASTTTPPPIWAERTVTQTLAALVGGKPDPKVQEETVHWTNPGFAALKRPEPPTVDIVEDDVRGPTAVPVVVGLEISSALDRTVVSPPPEAPRSRLRLAAALSITAIACLVGGYYLGLSRGTTIEKMPVDGVAAGPAMMPVAECNDSARTPAAAPVEDEQQPDSSQPAAIAASTPEPAVSRARSREPAPSSAQSCYLNAMTGPAGATVLVDGRVSGRTPLRTKVACGRHSVRFEMEGYQAATRTINARRGDTEKVTADLSRPRTVLRVESSPSGATVLVNGSSVGFTPLTTTIPGFVSTTVTLSKPGYKSFSKQLSPTSTSAKVAATLKAGTTTGRPRR